MRVAPGLPPPNGSQAIGVLQIEDHEKETRLKKKLHRQEGQDKPRRTSSKTRSQEVGSRTASRTESKNLTTPRPLGSPPLTAFDPGSSKWDETEAGERCYRDGWGNKAWIPAGGGPEVSRAPLRPPDARVHDGEDGPQPQEPSTRRRSSGGQQDKLARERSLIRQLETNLQHREEALYSSRPGPREGPESGASVDKEW